MTQNNQRRWPNSNRGQRQSLSNTTAKLLIMGARQVGKSAAIVRFTTGRFIQNYCTTTQDWLYKHPIEQQQQQAQQTISTIELLELKDTEASQPATIQELDPTSAKKLQWADAFVVIYSIASSKTFDKARGYLDLVRLASQQQSHARPVLLLANKNELGPPARQVSTEEGQELARSYRCLFAEISIARSASSIGDSLMQLVGQIDPARLSRLSRFEEHTASNLNQSELVRWRPTTTSGEHIPATQGKPIWSHLVRTSFTPIVSSVASSNTSSSVATSLARPPKDSSDLPKSGFCRPLLKAAPASGASFSYIARGELAEIQTVSSQLVSSASKPATNGNNQQQQVNKQRYVGSLRSSFKKASLAIVGSKTLAFKSAKQMDPPGEPALPGTVSETSSRKGSFATSDSVEAQGAPMRKHGSNLSLATTTTATATASKPSKSSWIKSKFTSSGSVRQDSQSMGSDSKLGSQASIDQAQQQLQQQPQKTTKGFRRPLFKYRNRVKTVAFEPNYTSSEVTPMAGQSMQPSDSTQTMAAVASLQMTDNEMPLSAPQDGRGSDHIVADRPGQQQQPSYAAPSDKSSTSSSGNNLNRCNSNQSNSSLSTSDTYYSSLFIVCHDENEKPAEEPVAQAQPTVLNQNCRVLSSACSTSSGRDSRSSSIFSGGGGGGGFTSGPRALLQKFSMKQRKDSRSTLSRASTSGGSYGDDEDEDEVMTLGEESADEEQASANGSNINWVGDTESRRYSNPLPAPPVSTMASIASNTNANKPPIGRGQQQQHFEIKATRHHQMVETIQHTSLASQVLAPKVGKISFCKALIKSIGAPKRCEAAYSRVSGLGTQQQQQHQHQNQDQANGCLQMASIEQIKTIPVAGYCK